MKNIAIEKIKKELKEAKKLDNKANAIKKAVADALICFCKQDDEFAQAIVQTDKTLSDCLKNISKGIGNAISDLEIYNKAVKFYFSTAKVEFHMTIDLCGDIDKPDPETNKNEIPKPKLLDLNFNDLFGNI